MQTLLTRARSKTPPFFTKLRNISIIITASATALLSAPVVLPVALTTAAGYLLTAGLVAGSVSQLTVTREGPTAAAKPVKKRR